MIPEMRAPVDASKVRALIEGLGRLSKGPGRVYLTGGASAVLIGWRESTVDVDLKLDPEPAGAFAAIAELKRRLDVNVKLAAPDQFLPPPSDWRDRSTYVSRSGPIDFFHYDFRAQALAKLARAFDRDLRDVEAMLGRGLVEAAELREVVAAIRPELVRYPALDAEAFVARVERFLATRTGPP